VLFQVKRGTICQFTVVLFDFYSISNIFSCPFKTEKFDCEKTELSGITDRSHKATVTSRPLTGLGHQRGE